MSLALDPATEARIQREIDRGRFREPSELLAHALDLLETETAARDWLLRNRDALNQRLDLSFAQSERGESYSPEQARTLLAERRAMRHARPTPQP
jgi:Arc/MetJ-type ribon-helix-helix transcriptional regulator